MSEKKPSNGLPSSPWQAYRQEIQFLVLFVVILGGGFTLISVNAVNDNVIVPFTAVVARASGFWLHVIDSSVEMHGTIIRNPQFAVNIQNGCNGIETIIIFLAAVIAFPASWKARIAGLAIGIVAIQIVNLVRVVALFLTGVHFPALFDNSHTVIWQTIVILSGVLLWIFWANRFAVPRGEAAHGE